MCHPGLIFPPEASVCLRLNKDRAQVHLCVLHPVLVYQARDLVTSQAGLAVNHFLVWVEVAAVLSG